MTPEKERSAKGASFRTAFLVWGMLVMSGGVMAGVLGISTHFSSVNAKDTFWSGMYVGFFGVVIEQIFIMPLALQVAKYGRFKAPAGD